MASLIRGDLLTVTMLYFLFFGKMGTALKSGLPTMFHPHFFKNVQRFQNTKLSTMGQMKDLEQLLLFGNPDITKAEIDKLKKILPKCSIENDAEK